MKKYVIGNLKMNLLSVAEREVYLDSMKKELAGKKFEQTQIVLCPPFIHLERFSQLDSKKTAIGAQNVFAETKGAYTGEISPMMLKNFGCEYVIVGHSERRRYFGESDEEINMKMAAILRNGMNAVLCVGETKQERENGQALEVIIRQLEAALFGISRIKTEHIIVVYEPIWSVGSDNVPITNEIMEARLIIKKILIKLFSKKYAEQVAILYGGSVNAKNINQVCLEAGMNGALVGRESLLPSEFVKIAELIDKK